MEVECSIDTLGYLVIWLFGELHYVFTKLLVIVSVYSGATIQKNYTFRSGPASENYWAM